MNGILVIDKPASFTSHDVVAVARRLLQEKQIGHLGTLDPLATGVLPLAVGGATRLIEFTSYDKEYMATCLLGKTTDSCDITGKVLEEKPTEGLSPEKVRAEVEKLKALTEQVPPMVSAVRSGGKKLYELARKGVVVERKARPIRIQEIEVQSVEMPRVRFRVVCSAGTYIRVLCQTLGEVLGVGGCLETLRRTRVGPFSLDPSLNLEDIKKKMEEGNLSGILLASSRLVGHLPAVKLEDGSLKTFCHGISVRTFGAQAGLARVLNEEGRLCAVGEVSPENEMKPRKVFGVEGIP